MTRRGAAVLVGLLALGTCGAAVAQTEDGDGYVNGQKGAYRGRVLDAETGRPLASVVVVAVWRRDRVRRPFFTIFLPSYGRPREVAGTPPTPPWTFYEGAGHTVELLPLRTREERREYAGRMDPYGLSEAPFKEIPEFMRFVNQESIAVGLQPYPPAGRQP